MANPFAFVTLLTSDSYLPGALALAGALKDVHPSPPVHPEVDFQTVCLVTPETVDVATIKLLRRAFNVVIGVELIGQDDDRGLQLLGRPDLHSVLTKLHIFRLTQYKKIIFLDADVLPIRSLSHLFHIEHPFSAAPDVGWPDIFNSGVLVITPGNDKFEEVRAVLDARGSWDGGDQGVLNEWRGDDWNRLSFTYNTTPTAAYTYAPAYERFGSQISAIHFIGPNKPWNAIPYRPSRINHESNPNSRNQSPVSPTTPVQLQAQPPIIPSPTSTSQAYDYASLVDRWFAVYDAHYRSQSLVPEQEFEVKRYMSAWDEQTITGADMLEGSAGAPSGPSSRSRAALSFGPPASLANIGVPVGGALSLEDLRRLAVEGISRGTGGGMSGGSGEGEYISMPLDGRVDLIRPRKVYPPAEDPDEQPEAPTTNLNDLGGLSLPATPAPPPGRFRRGTYSAQLSPTLEVPHRQHREHHHHHAKHHSHHLGSSHSHLQPAPKHDLLRVPSPPVVSWNPSIEPPPTTASPSVIPDTYFPNVWDHKRDLHSSSRSGSSDGLIESSSATSPPMPDSGAFFAAPPPSQIPEQLLQQGHYRQVTGDGESTTPSPDRNKVRSVFPWEQQPRQRPARVFPGTDQPPPGIFVQSPEAEPPSPLAFSSLERQMGDAKPKNLQSPSPLNLGSQSKKKVTYANAWDTVPQITKYANRLARPAPAHSPLALAPPFEETRKSWDDDPASRDGDDEGDGDDEEDGGSDDEPVTGQGDEGGQEEGRPKRKGVQTAGRVKKSLGVQVGTGTETEKPPEKERRPHARTRRSVGGAITPPSALGRPDLDKASQVLLGASSPYPQFRSPSGFRAPRESRSPRQASSESPSPTRRGGATTPKQSRVPRSRERRVSTSTTTVTSPPSSVGPMSPADGQAIGGPMRTGGRVWDPARGVELFKRGSEEVLARFLRMGNWEEENAAQQHHA